MKTKQEGVKKGKTVAKKSAKKSAVKKSTKKEKKPLPYAEGEQCFWSKDGRVISNLMELSDALSAMDSEVFAYHANKERNDFADWIESVLQDTELAKSIRAAKKPESAKMIVIRRLKIYNV